MNGCKGAHSGAYGEVFAKKLNGQGPHEATYPYLNTSPKLTCPADTTVFNSGAYVQEPMADSYCSEEKLMSLVSTYGAAVSYIYASDTGFGNYANGVFDSCTSDVIDHAVLVVGYGTDPESQKPYWLVKNSWGTDWGNNGFIKIFRGKNMCGIGNYCYAAKCAASTGEISDPPSVPPPPPMPVNLLCDLNGRWPGLDGRFTLNLSNPLNMNNLAAKISADKCKP